MEFIILWSLALTASEASLVVEPTLLRHLLCLKHGPATHRTGLAIVGRFEDRGVAEQGGGGRSGCLGEAGPTVELSTVEVSCGRAEELGADTALVAGLVVFLPSCREISDINHWTR